MNSNTVRRVDLNVPFAEKDHAKGKGAQWDSEKKTWYIPPGADVAKFSQWLPATPDIPINIKAPVYAPALTTTRCWKCGKPTLVD